MPGRPLDDLQGTPSGEASHRPDEGEVVRGGADQSKEQEKEKEKIADTHSYIQMGARKKMKSRKRSER